MQDLHIFQQILNISQWHVQILHNAFFNNLLQKCKDYTLAHTWMLLYNK